MTRALVVTFSLTATLAFAEAPMNEPASWFDGLWPNAAKVRFQPTTLQEREVFTALIPGILRSCEQGGAPPSSLVTLAAKAGFVLQASTHDGETFWILREASASLRGAGAYVFRTGKAAPVFVQAPHADYDLGTGALGARLFASGTKNSRPRAFFTNTAHRYKSHPEERREDPEHPADVAHNAEHLFQLTTDLAVRTTPNARVIQLHGFSASEGSGRASIAAVVSAGRDAPTPWAIAVATALREHLGEGARLYPRDTRVLGGTRNVQARLIHTYPSAGFLHLELSAAARAQFAEPERFEKLCSALLGPLESASSP